MPAWNSPSDSRPRLHHPDPPLPTSVQARSRTSRSLYPASSWPAIPADHLALTRNPHHRRQTMTRTILITGTSSGFGRETAERLARDGYRVFAAMRDIASRNRSHADALRGQKIGVVELDVTDDGPVDRAIASILAEAGKINVLVNNAGIASVGVTEAFTADQAKAIFDTNVIRAPPRYAGSAAFDASGARRPHYQHGLGPRPGDVPLRRHLRREQDGDRSFDRQHTAGGLSTRRGRGGSSAWRFPDKPVLEHPEACRPRHHEVLRRGRPDSRRHLQDLHVNVAG